MEPLPSASMVMKRVRSYQGEGEGMYMCEGMCEGEGEGEGEGGELPKLEQV